MERFPLSLINDPTAVTNEDRRDIYNNILLFTVMGDNYQRSPSEMHIFQCKSSPVSPRIQSKPSPVSRPYKPLHLRKDFLKTSIDIQLIFSIQLLSNIVVCDSFGCGIDHFLLWCYLESRLSKLHVYYVECKHFPFCHKPSHFIYYPSDVSSRGTMFQTSSIIVMWTLSLVTEAEALADAAGDRCIIGRSLECASWSYHIQLSKSLRF